MAFDSDWFDRVLAGRFKPDCTTCGRNDWSVFSKNAVEGDPSTASVSRIVLGATWPDGKPVDDFGFAVFAFVCNHCGNVRFQTADPIETIGDDSDEEPEPETQTD